MLRLSHIARFAFQHSPEKEQRILMRQNPGTILDQNLPDESADTPDTQKGVPKHVQKIQNTTREKLAFLNDLSKSDSEDEDERNAILSTFFQEHEGFLDTYFQSELHRKFTPELAHSGTLDQLRGNFSAELKEIAMLPEKHLGPKYNFFGTEKEFVQRYMKEKLKLSSDQVVNEEQVEQFKSTNYVPNAFICGTTIHFNMADEAFNLDKKLEAQRKVRPNITEEQALEIVEKNRERAAIHEIAHFCLDRETGNNISLAERIKEELKLAMRVKKLSDNADWKSLIEAVNTAFQGKFRDKSDVDYLHEAIAITMAGQRKPYEKDDPHRLVVDAVKKLRSVTNGNTKIRELFDEFDNNLSIQLIGDSTHESSFDFARRKMDVATSERTENLEFQRQCEIHGILRPNPPETDEHAEVDAQGRELAKEELDVENQKVPTPYGMRKKIQSVRDNLKKFAENKENMLSKLPKEAQNAEGIAYDKMISKFSADNDELQGIENSVRILENWENGSLRPDQKNEFASKFKFSDLGKYDVLSNKSTWTVLDAANKSARQDVIKELDDVITSYYKPIETICKGMNDINDVTEDHERKVGLTDQFHDHSFLGWINKRFGNNHTSNIAWLSVFDIIKVYNIYKEAILDKYHSKQKSRTGDAAKNWNIWKPLQPDLDKQARSANEEEVHSFKEFLQKEGFTYDQLFGQDGALQNNRSNVNRAKAVLEYAADHAWLYHLDKHNGHDVYGVDYEGIFGMRTFEELVEHNNAQQDKEKSNGRAKVDNYPDIHLLIEDIEHELQKKNIWMVLGIVGRLQEKAKYSESNTWALAAIIKALRDDKDGTLREVFAAGGKGLMDSIGTLGISQSAWSLTLFKTQRHALTEWIKLGCSDEATKIVSKKYTDSGYLKPHSFVPEVITHIENELYDNPKNYDKFGNEGLNRNVAKVLAAQTVKGKGGKHISIFNDDKIFNGYRSYWKMVQTTTDPSKTDDDFFNPANGGADIRLLWQEGVNAILECTSLGQFANEPKARGYLMQTLMLEEDLKKNNPAAHANYIRETKEKLTSWYSKSINNENTRKTFGTYRTINLEGSPGISDKNIMFELWKRDLIDKEYYISFINGFADAKVPPELESIRGALDNVKKLKSKTPPVQADIDVAQNTVNDILRRTGPK